MTAHLFALRQAQIGLGTTIRRALPQRNLRRIGAWCFLDHAGPVHFTDSGLDVGPHPHVGLQTFTWMIDGELLHRDSLGHEQLIKPKQVNLMTAGHGIVHSETTPAGVKAFHSAQLWIALPKEYKDIAPRFEHFPQLPEKTEQGVEYTVLMGDFKQMSSPVPSYIPLVGVDIRAQSAQQISLALRPDFEYGVLVLSGKATVAEATLDIEHLFYSPVGTQELVIHLEAGCHFLLIGGEPYTDPLAMWWNFVVHDQKDLDQAYHDWQHRTDRFPVVPGYKGESLDAPVLSERVKFS